MSEWPLSKECFVTSVTLATLKAFGLESLDWEPEILRDAFEEQFDMKKMPQKLFDKLNCGYTLVGTDAFNSTIEGFLSCTAIMNNLVFDESEPPFCSLEMCAWSVWEYSLLLGDLQDGKPTVEFSPDITAYIREAGKLNGVSRFPKWLSFANPESEPMPDMTGDTDLFEMYNARQDAFISNMNGFVTAKQQRLNEELRKLEELKIIGNS